jgi:hypothetical protein
MKSFPSSVFRFRFFSLFSLAFSLFLILNTAMTAQSNYSPPYDSIISYYSKLSKQHTNSRFIVKGKTDVGKPMHIFVISGDGDFVRSSIRTKNKSVLLINNGIHPGEPDGINASMTLAKTILENPAKYKKLLDKVVIVIIPVYNVDGALTRGCCSRVNQDGPEEYGFRGNGQNLDLNRDFIKMDSENALSFIRIFQEWDPDVLVDTHVSNGADYPYTMTLIPSQKDKLQKDIRFLMEKVILPPLQDSMKKAGWPIAPYVNTKEETPESGIIGFLETPRYSTGYAALFNTVGFVTETHMLKPFDQRVKATEDFLFHLLSIMASKTKEIIDFRIKAKKEVTIQKDFPVAWTLDTSKWTMIDFNGYAAKYKPSEVSGKPRLYYDQKESWQKKIRFYDTYTPGPVIQKPDFYILPQGWKNVVFRMQINGIKMKQLSKDTTLEVDVYYITDFKTGNNPFEGHYPHTDIKIRTEKQKLKYFAGDWVIPVNQEKNRFIVETLEPQGTDSWFTWNFFDGILSQKEWFSDYVFEDLAAELLKKDPALKKELEDKKSSDKEFADNAWAQLYFVYQRSPYYEKSHRRYPVGRYTGNSKLPLKEN